MVFNYIFIAFIAFLCLYPMLYVLFASFSDNSRFMQHIGLLLWPAGFSTMAYAKVFQNPMIALGYRNTLIILAGGLAVNLFMTSLGAYFLSRKNVLFKKPVMMLVTFTMFFSGGMIPAYLNMRDFGLLNNLWGLIIPGAISTYNMIIMRTSFQSIPDSLTEAAYIDGAGHFTILFKVILPLSTAIIAVMVLWYGIGIWNSWFWASVILRDRTLWPLQVVLRGILLQNQVSDMADVGGDVESVAETIKYATIIVATVPILCIYPFLQKYFAKGALIGSLKE
jgi:putative aldouronate transport system permease protein